MKAGVVHWDHPRNPAGQTRLLNSNALHSFHCTALFFRPLHCAFFTALSCSLLHCTVFLFLSALHSIAFQTITLQYTAIGCDSTTHNGNCSAQCTTLHLTTSSLLFRQQCNASRQACTSQIQYLSNSAKINTNIETAMLGKCECWCKLYSTTGTNLVNMV